MSTNYDELKLYPDELRAIADIIEGYCRRQSEVMNEYKSNIDALSNEWKDEQTLGSLIAEINMLKNQVTKIMDEIQTHYPAYFRQKAIIIETRPTF